FEVVIIRPQCVNTFQDGTIKYKKGQLFRVGPFQTFGGAGGRCFQSLLFFFIFNVLFEIDFFGFVSI
ncbi:hypothetical protein AB6E08_21845, partial [Vibrio sp. 10N.247.310.24]|uniref:hypothetical protein n=1 Tax=Vibrio sp. 10N.247.310.24 TaxID=3229984 RepID=UPI0035531C7F